MLLKSELYFYDPNLGGPTKIKSNLFLPLKKFTPTLSGDGLAMA